MHDQQCQESLQAFCHLMKYDFLAPDHIKKIIKVLEDVESGKTKRLIISCPPRHGKTLTSTLLFSTWYLGRNPNKDIIIVSYNEQLANDFGRDIRNYLQTPEFSAVFPSVALAKDSTSMKHFNMNQGGSLSAVGMGGTITGRGGHVIIIDDLFRNDQEARSIVNRSNVIKFWQSTLYTRQQNKDAAFIIVNNRWHEYDLIGHLLKNSTEKWEHIKFQAINEKGEALWPEKFDLNFFQVMQRDNTIQTWMTQYQQEPFSQQGEYVKVDELQDIEEKDIPKNFDNMVISFDLAFKGGEENDFNVGQFWGCVGPDYYLVDMIRGRWDFHKLLFHVKRFLQKHQRCSNVLIEDSARGAPLGDVLMKHFPGIQLWPVEGDKIARVNSVSPIFRSKNVWINKGIYDHEQDPGQLTPVQAFKHEMIAFDNGENDDTVDTCTMSLINLKNQPKSICISLGESIF